MVGTVLGLLMAASGVGLLAAWHETKVIQGGDAAACAIVFLLWLVNRRARSRLQARGFYHAKPAGRSWARLSPLPWGTKPHAAKPRRVRLQR